MKVGGQVSGAADDFGRYRVPRPTGFLGCGRCNRGEGAGGAAETASNSEEIIVTARKRAESLQDVPLSVTDVNAAAIERNNIFRIDQVGALTPNVLFQPISSVPTGIAAFIRGVGNRTGEPSQDSPIAISLDGVYLTGTAGSLLDVFDVQQIEVLAVRRERCKAETRPAARST